MYTLFSDFHIALIFYISIDDIYDYTMDYMENVARNFTKNIRATLSIRKAKTR